MAGHSWREVKEALCTITPICTAHDDDGVDLYFLNARNLASHCGAGGWKIRSAEQVETLFNRCTLAEARPPARVSTKKPFLCAYEQAIAANGDPD